MGIKGNEIADTLAKEALLKVITVTIPLGKGEGKAVVKRTGLETWQKWWEEDRKGRKYYELQKSVSIKNYMKKKQERGNYNDKAKGGSHRTKWHIIFNRQKE